MMTTEASIAEANSTLKEFGPYLKGREKEFLESIIYQFSTPTRRRELSFGQKRWLQSILQKYDSEFKSNEEEWKSSFDAEKRSIAISVAKYYRFTPYYTNYVIRILEDPEGFFLNSDEWKKFCENKYALNIRKQYEESPKFSVSECVKIRSNNRLDLANSETPSPRPRRNSHRNSVAFILAVDAKPITRAAKGSRLYKILINGEVAPVYAHESDLKKFRRSSK